VILDSDSKSGYLVCSPKKENQLSKFPKSNKVKSHGSNVRDVIIAHMISGDAQTKTYTGTQMQKM